MNSDCLLARRSSIMFRCAVRHNQKEILKNMLMSLRERTATTSGRRRRLSKTLVLFFSSPSSWNSTRLTNDTTGAERQERSFFSFIFEIVVSLSPEDNFFSTWFENAYHRSVVQTQVCMCGCIDQLNTTPSSSSRFFLAPAAMNSFVTIWPTTMMAARRSKDTTVRLISIETATGWLNREDGAHVSTLISFAIHTHTLTFAWAYRISFSL